MTRLSFSKTVQDLERPENLRTSITTMAKLLEEVGIPRNQISGKLSKVFPEHSRMIRLSLSSKYKREY